jgi:hypothetical protein
LRPGCDFLNRLPLTFAARPAPGAAHVGPPLCRLALGTYHRPGRC